MLRRISQVFPKATLNVWLDPADHVSPVQDFWTLLFGELDSHQTLLETAKSTKVDLRKAIGPSAGCTSDHGSLVPEMRRG